MGDRVRRYLRRIGWVLVPAPGFKRLRVSRVHQTRQTFDTPIPTMDPYDYPGKGLSLVQLVFALNEELRHSVCSQMYIGETLRTCWGMAR